ncbi:IS3 family transposase [Romboutsia sedimentorum]
METYNKKRFYKKIKGLTPIEYGEQTFKMQFIH